MKNVLNTTPPTPVQRMVIGLRLTASVDRVRAGLSEDARALALDVGIHARPLVDGIACVDDGTIVIDEASVPGMADDLLDSLVRHEMGHAVYARRMSMRSGPSEMHSVDPKLPR